MPYKTHDSGTFWRYLDGRLAGDVGHQEVHGDVLTVHVVVDPVLDTFRQGVRIAVVPVLKQNENITRQKRYFFYPVIQYL